MVNIKTGADKLIDIISEKKKIRLDAAAKLLGVGKDVVQEWAEFLEEEGLISIDYNFSQIWLFEKKITKKDVIQNAKEIDSQKEALARKIDVILGSLNHETAGFEEVKKHFSEMQSHIKNELSTVKEQLNELEKYNQLRKNLDREIEQQKLNYAEMMKKTSNDFRSEEQKFLGLTSQIEQERKTLDGYQTKLDDIKKTKDDLDKNMNFLREYMKNVDKTSSEYKSMISNSNKKISALKNSLNIIESEIKGRKSHELESNFAKLQKQMTDFGKKQTEITQKIKEKTTQMSNYSELDNKIQNNFQGFLMKNIALDKTVQSINEDKEDLRKSLEVMKEKVESFSVISKNKSILTQINEIEFELKKIERKKSTLKQKIEGLFSSIKGNNPK